MADESSGSDDMIVNFYEHKRESKMEQKAANFIGFQKEKKRKKTTTKEKVHEKITSFAHAEDQGVVEEEEKGHETKHKKKKRLESRPQKHPDNGSICNVAAEGEEGKKHMGRKGKKRKRVPQDDYQGLGNVAPGISTVQHGVSAEYIQPDVDAPKAEAGSRSATEIRGTSGAIRHTVSIAVAGSIIDNAQSMELATVLAGQIARAAAIFRIDEVVVFDDGNEATQSHMKSKVQTEDVQESAGQFLVRILEYLEVPQYLRRALIPRHTSLCSVGRLPPLDAPHHLRRHEWQPYREGVVLDKDVPSGSGSYVDVGLYKEALIQQSLNPGTRVTVAMGTNRSPSGQSENVLKAVDREVVLQAGIYWGYKVRYAGCLNAVFNECPYEGGYDYRIGTSEHGEKIRCTDLVIPKFKHLLIAFGGLAGLEESLEVDKSLKVPSIASLFHQYLNTCPNQGSRTIRTEEAILISLQYLQESIQGAVDSV